MIASIPDLVNAGFEVFGGIANWINVFQLCRDKKIQGVYWPSWIGFGAWGLWNLYYYPSLHQWASFIGGIVIVSANLTWVGMAIKYIGRKGHS